MYKTLFTAFKYANDWTTIQYKQGRRQRILKAGAEGVLDHWPGELRNFLYIYIYIYIYVLMSQTCKYFSFKPWRRANGYYISNVNILRKRYAGERLNLSKLEKVKVKTE